MKRINLLARKDLHFLKRTLSIKCLKALKDVEFSLDYDGTISTATQLPSSEAANPISNHKLETDRLVPEPIRICS